MPSRLGRPTVVIAVVAVLAVATAAAWRFWPRSSEAPSVAVLPFTSPQDEASYFTDGFHDAVISQLARIQGLKAISRTSVLGYRGAERDLAQIARELGVEHLVEASVHRAGERLRVSARLVAGSSGRELWSAEYDRPPAEIFSVQADMAREIAGTIDARLTLEEEARLRQAPTRDLQAYDLYLRALEVENRTPPDKAALAQALGWLGEALERDREFALAHATASRIHMAIYWVVGEYDKARLPIALEHARRAIELAPDLAAPHLAMALYWYWGHREYEKALGSLGDALALEPNSSAVSFLTGSIYRRLGRWDVSISSARHAAQLDPRNARNLQVYADVLIGTRNFREADETLAGLMSVAPKSPLAFYMRLENQLRWTGDEGALAPDFRRFDGKDDPYCVARLAEYDLRMVKRQYAAAAAAILACPGDSIGALHNVPGPKQQFAALAELFAGNRDRARAHAAVARAVLKKRLDERPDLPLTRAALAYMLAIEGDTAGALAETDRALADAPMSKDAIVGAELRDLAAALHAHLGQRDRALAELTETLTMAYGSYARLVASNPLWNSLRDDPRFKQLVEANLARDK
jgi:TolB-like protein